MRMEVNKGWKNFYEHFRNDVADASGITRTKRN